MLNLSFNFSAKPCLSPTQCIAGRRGFARTILVNKGTRPERRSCRWQRPAEGWWKVNVDGVFRSSTGSGGLGVVIRDHSGVVLLAAWRAVPGARDAEEVEAMADREGLRLAAKDPRCVVLESDSSSVCALLNSRSDRGPLQYVAEEARHAGGLLPEWRIVRTRREGNRAAHELTQLALRSNSASVWRHTVPVAGAAADASLPLEEVAEQPRDASKLVGTMGVALSWCMLPGQGTSDCLGPDQMELALELLCEDAELYRILAK